MDKTFSACAIMKQDDIIWHKLGITCSGSSDPSEKSVENSWEEYLAEWRNWYIANGKPKLDRSVDDQLTDENFHSASKVLSELGAF
jgi:hypothetical protein